MRSVICKDTRACFARGEITKACGLLNLKQNKNPYKDGECPFCKPDKEVTNGKRYPYNPYGCKMKGETNEMVG